MAKFRFRKSKTRKAAIAALCAITVTCTSLAAACQNTDDGNSAGDDTPRAEDTSTLTNGSFEFFNVPDDGVYLIKNVQDWSRSGDSSGTMSGILDTSESNWDAITSPDLADKLNTNNDLLTSDDDYVDYNGMKSGDIPYKDTYAAKLEESAVKDDKIINKNDMSYAKFLGIIEDDGTYKYGEDEVEVYYDEVTGDFYFDYDEDTEEYSNPVRKDVIKNPETHWGSYNEKDGKYYLGEHEIYVDDDGNYYKDENKEYSEGNVLMIHNYPTDTKYNGIQQYYSSTTVSLEARTAAKISVWVKTSDLKFDKGYSLLDEQDRGAFIEVIQTVGGTTIDSFTIKAINTEKILAANNDLDTNNGWLQYNIYVNACDFASCTVQLRLGLGKPNGETCTGYAFFDDVTVEKQRDISKTGYNEVASEIQDKGTYCTLSNTDDEKIFYADATVKGNIEDRHSKDFNYLIDLASESGTDGYTTFDLSGNVTAGLTTEEEDGVTYASAANYEGNSSGLGSIASTDYRLYKKATERHTDKDFLGLFTHNDTFTGKIKGDADKNNIYSNALNNALLGEKTTFKELPNYTAESKMLVMYSFWGAAYTSSIVNDDKNTFTLDAGEQMIVTFWVKTSDMNGKAAATFYIYDVEDTDKEYAQELNVDTTDITTDIDDEKDIYNGWVQCFFFVQNNTKEDNKTFKIDFHFGNTSIISASSYNAGWVALANMQTLKITEEVYNLTATANYTKKFQFSTDDKEKTNKKFADALGTYDITEEIALPDGYNGVNGGSSSVSDSDYSHYFDIWNTNHVAGLINRDTFNDADNKNYDWDSILKSFSASATNWDEVFGKDCYQPLIIVNNLRRYADNAHANKDNYTDYYVLVDDGYVGDTVTDNAGRRYKKAGDEPFDEDETYYSFKEVVNYGFVGTNKTISSGATEIITVKVMVTEGATAYIYLVDTTTREIMGYSVPGYTFWYDDEGNVLDCEFDEELQEDDDKRDEHTVYEKQDNGLYKDKDGNFVANLYNLKKIYQKEKLKTYYYYDKNGDIKEFRGTRCEEGIEYYTDEECTKEAPHRLCNSDDKPIYEYNAEDGKYYYIVDGKVTDTEVGYFDTQYARYKYNTGDEDSESLDDAKYFVKVDPTGVDENGQPRWVTVNFVVRAGNNSKSYRLELWSGERDKVGEVDGNEKTDDTVSGAVAFDYSAYPVTSSNYENILRTDNDSYEKTIIAEYQELLAGHEDEFPLEEDATIKAYEKLAAQYLDESAYEELKKSYVAHYYTYSLYDTEEFIPYNKEVAEDGDTDYEYTAPDSEDLAFFSNVTKDKDGKITSYNMFIDYSAVEKAINKTNAPTDNGSDSDDGTTPNAGDFWLQLASILLVVVLLFVLLALVARIIIKKIRRKKSLKNQSKNVYRKRKRYLRKLHIEEEETEEIDNPALLNSEETEEPVEEAHAEEVTEETPAPEAPAEATEEPVEETPVEEAPAETTENPEEKPE